MSTRPFVFLTDTEPRLWRVCDLCEPAHTVSAEQAPAPRQWFTAANNLGLALARSGARKEAADLMQVAIGLANHIAARDPNGVELGIESWINRIDLLRGENTIAAEQALRSCYSLILARPITRQHTFGLNVARLNDADHSVTVRATAIVRNRSQSGLLKLLLDRGDIGGACEFAREVVSDFPRSVMAGMLHPVEILATHAQADPFLRAFDLNAPRTEGDFIVWLRTLDACSSHDHEGRLACQDLDAVLAGWSGRKALRNPRTPLLWAVHAAVASRAGDFAIANAVRAAVEACVESCDRQLYRAICLLAGQHVNLAGLPSVTESEVGIDPRSLVTRLIDTSLRVDRGAAAA